MGVNQKVLSKLFLERKSMLLNHLNGILGIAQLPCASVFCFFDVSFSSLHLPLHSSQPDSIPSCLSGCFLTASIFLRNVTFCRDVLRSFL